MYQKHETFSMPISSLVINKKSSTQSGEVSTHAIKNRLEEKSLSLSDIKVIMETLTDLQYAKKIKVASILSPKEITVPKLWLRLEGLKGQPDPVLLDTLENHFRNVYPLEKQLFNILGNVMFDHGSHTLAIIPPLALDEKISEMAKSGQLLTGESFSEHAKSNPLSLDVLDTGAKHELLDSMDVTLSDNIADIKKAATLRNVRSKNTLDKLTSESIRLSNSGKQGNPLLSFSGSAPEDSRENCDGVVFYLPPDSVAPVYDPTDPSKHIGYYVAIDGKTGMPVSKIKDSKLNSQLEDQLKDLEGAGTKLNAQFSGLPIKSKKIETDEGRDEFINAFEEKIAKELTNSISSSSVGSVEVSNSSEVYRLMLFKALKKESVKMIYLPAEMVTYFAFEHNAKGMGVSLIEKTKLMSSLRTLVMMSDVLANISNSTPITEVEIELDEDDPDQPGTVEKILNNIARIDKQRSPVGVFNVSDIITAFRKANTRIKVSGGEVFPNTSTSFSDTQRSVARVDQDLSESLAKQQHSGIDVPSELIDRAMEGEFAVSTHTTNHLWAMTNMLIQADFVHLLNDFIHKYIRFSPRLLKVIDQYKGDLEIDDILEALTVQLPKHDSASIESITEDFSAYSDLIDSIIEQYVSNDMLRDLVPDSDDLDDIGEVIQMQLSAYFKRQWLINNNILPEVTGKLFKDETDDFELSSAIGDFNSEMIESIKDMVNAAVKASGKADKKSRKVITKAESKRDEADPEQEESASAGDGNVTEPPVEDGQTAEDEPPVEDEFNF